MTVAGNCVKATIKSRRQGLALGDSKNPSKGVAPARGNPGSRSYVIPRIIQVGF
jgi:hypothetical protein